MKKRIHKIRFYKKPKCHQKEGRKLCTGELANQQCEEFSFYWKDVDCPKCKLAK